MVKLCFVTPRGTFYPQGGGISFSVFLSVFVGVPFKEKAEVYIFIYIACIDHLNPGLLNYASKGIKKIKNDVQT